jgi:YHS domain-containing protein
MSGPASSRIASRRTLLLTPVLAAAGAVVLAPKSWTRKAHAAPAIETSLMPGVALAGHDPVAYFTKAKPTPGRPEIATPYQGAEWYFESEANRAAFRANPLKYAPQYGGHCSWAMARGYTAKGDPEAWRIENGKLYLNYDLEIRARWEKDIPGFIAQGDVNWPKLKSAP